MKLSKVPLLVSMLCYNLDTFVLLFLTKHFMLVLIIYKCRELYILNKDFNCSYEYCREFDFEVWLQTQGIGKFVIRKLILKQTTKDDS